MVDFQQSSHENREKPSLPDLRESWRSSAQIAGTGRPGGNILDIFRAASLRFSDAIAVSDAEESWTYTQLWNYAAAFRARLVAQGVRPGTLVAIAADRSLPTVAAILGVVMAGGCYVPFNLEEFPPSLCRQLREKNDLRHWIADANSRRLGVLHAKEYSILPLEDVACAAGAKPAEIPAIEIDADSPLYVMFTSGSTGLPKGVVVPHRAVMRLVQAQNFMEFGPEHTFLLHSPLSFDASTLEFWGSLLHGSRLVVAPGGRLGLNDYEKLLAEQGVTTLWLTAAMFHLAAEHAPEMFAPLRQLLFGGDVISPRAVERVRKLYPQLHMVNGYGPTENTTFTCCYVVPPEYHAEATLPIGLPIAHTTIHVLNAQHLPVPAGQEGELATGGAGVALGYLGQPEATAERFIADPFSPEPEARLYLTGDRVRRRQNGTVEFLGRIDRQIKLAGHRVDLAAVESVISSSPMVVDAAIVVLHPAFGEKQLAACVSLLRALENAEAQLRRWLLERLSRAAVPQHWLFLKQLPINANGKLDRGALQTICETKYLRAAHTDRQGDSVRNASAGDAEPDAQNVSQIMHHLQHLWARLLGRESVGNDENFFDLGGTSLLLIEMHARLRAQFIEVPSLVEMFAFPTPRTLAMRLSGGERMGTESRTAEQRGLRQRAAMLAKRPGPAPTRAASSSETAPIRKDGVR